METSVDQETTAAPAAADKFEKSPQDFIINSLSAEVKLLKAKNNVQARELVDLKAKLTALKDQETVTQNELEDLKTAVNDLLKPTKTTGVKRRARLLSETEAKKYKKMSEYFTVIKGPKTLKPEKATKSMKKKEDVKVIKQEKEDIKDIVVKSESSAAEKDNGSPTKMTGATKSIRKKEDVKAIKQEKEDIKDIVVKSESSAAEEDNGSPTKKTGTNSTPVNPTPGKRRTPRFTYGQKETVIERIKEVLAAEEESVADTLAKLAETKFEEMELDLTTLKKWWDDREKILREIKRNPGVRNKTRR